MQKKRVMILAFVLILTARGGHSQKIQETKLFREAKSKNGVTVRIEIPKLKHAVLEPIILQIVVTNESSKRIVLVQKSVLQLANAEIVNTGSKEKVPLTLYGQRFVKRRGMPGSVPTIPLDPGKDYKFTINLTRAFDLSLFSDYAVSCNISYYPIEKKEMPFVKVDNLTFSVEEKPH